MILSLLASAALAGAVYVNGVRADVLPEVVLERCTVRLDGQGNVFIDAPGYKVNITDPGEAAAGPRAVSLGGPALPGGAVATVGAGVGAVAAGAVGVGATAVGMGASALPGGAVAMGAATFPGAAVTTTGARPGAGGGAAASSIPAAEAAPRGKWWLVTEDAASAGQTLEVRVNGYKVRTVRSGEAQVALDLGPWLRTGNNTVEVVPGAEAAGATRGSLGVFVGSGSPAAGVLRLEQPEIRYARRPGVAPAAQSFQLVVR